MTPLQKGKKNWEKLSDVEKRAWEECNWCYANSCINCSYRKIALKYGWYQ